MDNEAGYKRKETTSKVISSIKNFWFNWFGDFNTPIKKVIKYLFFVILLFLFGGIGFTIKELVINSQPELDEGTYWGYFVLTILVIVGLIKAWRWSNQERKNNREYLAKRDSPSKEDFKLAKKHYDDTTS